MSGVRRDRFKGFTLSWGAVGVSFVVSDEVLLVCLMASVSIHAALAWSTAKASQHIGNDVRAAVLSLERTIEQTASLDLPGNLVDDVTNTIQAEMSALIEDTLGSMHVPTAADHLFGALGTWVQARVMKDMGGLEAMAGALVSPDAAQDAEGVPTV